MDRGSLTFSPMRFGIPRKVHKEFQAYREDMVTEEAQSRDHQKA